MPRYTPVLIHLLLGQRNTEKVASWFQRFAAGKVLNRLRREAPVFQRPFGADQIVFQLIRLTLLGTDCLTGIRSGKLDRAGCKWRAQYHEGEHD